MLKCDSVNVTSNQSGAGSSLTEMLEACSFCLWVAAIRPVTLNPWLGWGGVGVGLPPKPGLVGRVKVYSPNQGWWGGLRSTSKPGLVGRVKVNLYTRVSGEGYGLPTKPGLVGRVKVYPPNQG